MRVSIPVVLFALLFTSGNAYAQTFEGIGLRVGVTTTGVELPEPGYESRTGLVVAGYTRVGLSPDLAVVAELEYALRGYRYVPFGEEWDATSDFHFLSVPVLLEVGIPLTRQVGFYVMAGPRIDFLLGGTVGSSPDGEIIEGDLVGLFIERGVFAGFSLAGGFNLPRVLARDLRLEGRFVSGVSDLLPDFPFQSANLSAVDITLGVTF